MAQLRNWVKLVRPIDTSNAALLALGSYPLSELLLWEGWRRTVAATVAIFAGTMLWNAWYDQKHDLKMGRPFANEHSKTLGALTAIVWGVVLTLLYLTFTDGNRQEFALLAFMAVGGFGYAWARLVPYTSTAVVALVFAAPTMLGVTELTQGNLLSASLILLVNINREILGDIRDMEYDREGLGRPWKATIPVLWGERTALRVYAAMTIMSVVTVSILGVVSQQPLRDGEMFLSAGVAVLVATYVPLKNFTAQTPPDQKRSIKDAASLINFTLYCYAIGMILI